MTDKAEMSLWRCILGLWEEEEEGEGEEEEEGAACVTGGE